MPERELEYLQKQARRCRSAASATFDVQARQTLLEVAVEYDQRAEAVKPMEKRATRRWGRADECMPDTLRVSGVLESLRKRASCAADSLSREELRRRSEQHDIDEAKIRIMQKVVKGLPINVFERRLIAGDLPPGYR